MSNLRQRFYPLAAPVPPQTQAMSRSASAERDNDTGFSRNYCQAPHQQEAVAAAVSNVALVLPLVMWLVALAVGAASHDGGGVPAEGLHLPLKWYDDIFTQIGPLLPLLPLGCRLLAGRAEEHRQRQRTSLHSTPPWPSATSPPRALVVYALVAVVRLVVYVAWQNFGSHEVAISDHVFLGASVVVILKPTKLNP